MPLGSMANKNDNRLLDSGAAYAFRRIGEAWSPSLYIKPATTHQEATFGGACDPQSPP